jgi:hypothetical protein
MSKPTLALLAVLLLACAEASAPPSWEAFRAQIARDYHGREVLVVEGDLAVTEEQARAWYERNVAHDGLGRVEQASIVNWYLIDDKWRDGKQLDLSYCISDEFGDYKARAVAEMTQATSEWQAVARVRFRYVPEHDASCNNANLAVVFSVRPGGGGACSFGPAGGGCVNRTLIMDFPGFDVRPGWEDWAPNMQTLGVFRHELGHILGLMHEQLRPEAGESCAANVAWRALSAYDRASVMHYPWCNGLVTSDMSITRLDAAGVRELYGMPDLVAGKPVVSDPSGWQVDLGAMKDLGEVLIHGAVAADGLDVLVSEDGATWRTAAVWEGTVPAETGFALDTPARHVRLQPRNGDLTGLASVEVLPPRNLALGKVTTQSSVALDAGPERAVDGNRNGYWENGSVTHTVKEAQPWWQVDLAATVDIGRVVLFNRRDCCGSRLANVDLLISDDAQTWEVAASRDGALSARTTFAIGRSARYLRVQLRGTDYLSLAEVEVYATPNLALHKPATQSSTSNRAPAGRAVDGDLTGRFEGASVTHTRLDVQPWWQVDLGTPQAIGRVLLYNRTDCCTARLSDVDLLVSDDAVSWKVVASQTGRVGARTELPIGATGRFLRVQLRGTNYLSLAEVVALP